MKPTDFFIFPAEADDSGVSWGTAPLRADLPEQLRRGAVDGVKDLDAAMGLAQLTHEELEKYGTGGGARLDDIEMGLVLKALKATLRRLRVTFPDLPFRNFTTFRSYWIREGMSNSWAARRDHLERVFAPLHGQLEELEEREFSSRLAHPISPRGRLDWPEVDEEIRELRRRFESATTQQDYRAVGMAGVGVLEALSGVVYDPAIHLREGEEVLPRDKTKQRIGRFVETALADDAELRRVVNAAIELAQKVKHNPTPTRRQAGVAADSVIMLANILRRLHEKTE
jgi:hypothetical protein